MERLLLFVWNFHGNGYFIWNTVAVSSVQLLALETTRPRKTTHSFFTGLPTLITVAVDNYTKIKFVVTSVCF